MLDQWAEIQDALRENEENIQLTAAQLLCDADEVSKVGTGGNISSLREAIEEGISLQMNMDNSIFFQIFDSFFHFVTNVERNPPLGLSVSLSDL